MKWKLPGLSKNTCGDSYSRPFWHYLMISLFLVSIIIIIVAVTINYENMEINSERNTMLLQNQTEANILRSFQQIDTGLKVYDSSFDKSAKKALLYLMVEYNRTGHNVTNIDTTKISRIIDSPYEVDIINRSSFMVVTTNPMYKEFDFKKNLPEFSNYLMTIIEKEGYFPERVVQEYFTGNLTKFAYMPTYDHNYVFQIDISAEEFRTQRSKLKYQDAIKDIQLFNPNLQSARIFTSAKRLVGNKSFTPSPELSLILDRLFKEKKNIEIIDKETGKKTRYLYIDLLDKNYSGDMSLVTELVYDSSKQKENTTNLLILHGLITAIALFVCLIAAIFVSRRLTRPIEQIVEDVNIIAKGDLDHKIRFTIGREFAVLEESINTMVLSLKDTIKRLKELELVINKSPAIAFVWKPEENWPIEFVSDNISILGYKPEDFTVREMNYSMLVHPDDLQKLNEEIKSYTEAGVKEYTQEYRLITRTGVTMWVEDRTWVRTDNMNNVLGYQGVVIDISERKAAEIALEMSEIRLKAIIDVIPDIILVVNEDGLYLDVMTSHPELLFKPPDELKGRLIQNIIPKNEANLICDAIEKAIETEEVQSVDYKLSTPAGIKWFEGKVTLSKEIIGGKKILVCFIRDITQRKQIEKEIQDLNLKLEQRVKERTKDLEIANKDLESFSYSVSHDLRAPLRSIDGYIGIIFEDHIEDIDLEVKHYLERCRENADRMSNLIDDLLTFSRTSRHISLEKRTISPVKIVNEIKKEFINEISSRNIEFIIEEMPDCMADLVLLNQVYVNLISNAVKFTRKTEKPKITVGAITDGQVPVYFVEDNGDGFDMKYIDKLFIVFQRLHSQDQFEGTGVGLAIVDRIIKRHGGRIWATSELEKGAKFYFTLEPEKELDENGEK